MELTTDLTTSVPSPIETACFRIVQEALTNVMRHAQAEQVHIRLWQNHQVLHLHLCDNGLGFDLPTARKRATQGGSLGLLGMEERALLAGGQLLLKSTSAGTEIDVRFPITPQTLAASGTAG